MKESDGLLHQMTWPPQSPDLNPIEMVWDELDCRVKEKQPTCAQHIWELLQDCWKSIPGEAGWENKPSKSNQMLFVTCVEYNRCRPYREMLTYKPLTNNAVQEMELRKYLRTSLCSALRSDAEQLPYQAVMQPVRMLSMVQL
ncbi:unnamed protein product [Oncorhynchus mykiss]|uniref:Tc1-like transposase DDE domain-containing protein n=1 Tax=Oncorhynchus mykiss TaxID=8022 RepID=A0A060XM17_ONCMY|nr:unnamed protein product [Oncorhynchus mykiss]